MASTLKVDTIQSTSGGGDWVGGGYRFSGLQIFTASAQSPWTKPAGVTAIMVYVTGPGGGGGGAGSTNDAGAGGSAGGTAIEWITSGLGSTETITIGTGGAAAGSSTAGGSDGSGVSSFGSHCSASQGLGGRHGNDNPGNKLGGVGTGGTFNLRGGCSEGGEDNAHHVPNSRGGDSYWEPGGNGGSYHEATTVGLKGSGGGGGFDQGSTGDAASAGGDGYIVVYEYKGGA